MFDIQRRYRHKFNIEHQLITNYFNYRDIIYKNDYRLSKFYSHQVCLADLDSADSGVVPTIV